jgi:hypothetical protein
LYKKVIVVYFVIQGLTLSGVPFSSKLRKIFFEGSLEMLSKMRQLQADYIRLVEDEDPRHVDVLQEYLDLVSGQMQTQS